MADEVDWRERVRCPVVVVRRMAAVERVFVAGVVDGRVRARFQGASVHQAEVEERVAADERVAANVLMLLVILLKAVRVCVVVVYGCCC